LNICFVSGRSSCRETIACGGGYVQTWCRLLTRRKADHVYERKLDGREEEHLVALSYSDPPGGRSRWSLHLLAEHFVALKEITPPVTLSTRIIRFSAKKMTRLVR